MACLLLDHLKLKREKCALSFIRANRTNSQTHNIQKVPIKLQIT